MDILEEQLRVVLGNWGNGPFSFDGEHYTLRELEAEPKPVQRPHPPLIMGGNAGRRSAALAARYADEYNTTFPTLDAVRERSARIAEACAEAGREPLAFSVMTGMVIGADAEDLRDRLRRLSRVRGEDAGAFATDPPTGWVVGTLDEAAEQLIGLRDAGVSRAMCQQLLHEDLEAVALLAELAALIA
jgi:alkanesulfonate monooxygenase SsuD/methylene tetrahydromethanopterin reductase-like flavin-dependent oxidoreductase (luciferase family)